MRAPDRKVGAHRERAREIVLGRHVDDDRHAQPMRNRDRFFERRLAVPDDMVGDHEKNGGGVLGDRILEVIALDPCRRPGRHHPCARQGDRLSDRRAIVDEMSRPDHDLGSEPGGVGQSLDAREIVAVMAAATASAMPAAAEAVTQPASAPVAAAIALLARACS